MKLAACEKCGTVYTGTGTCYRVMSIERPEYCVGKVVPLDAPKAQERRCNSGTMYSKGGIERFSTCCTCKQEFLAYDGNNFVKPPICPGKQEPPKQEPRRMQGNPCPVDDSANLCLNSCLHQTEHDEIRDTDKPEPWYQDTCAYHNCQPVAPVEPLKPEPRKRPQVAITRGVLPLRRPTRRPAAAPERSAGVIKIISH